MYVITLQELWVSVIDEGIKVIETRSWSCKQFGELYILRWSIKNSCK